MDDKSSGPNVVGQGSDENVATTPQVYPGATRLAIVALTCSISGFLSGLDQTILATAIPQITKDFHSLTGIAWWTSSYLLTSATFQLVYGRCNTLFSVKYVYICANVFFAFGSLICAVAPNSIALIAGRAIAGIGVAGMMSGNVLIIAASAPLERRASLTGMMFAFLGIASVVGPFIGGVLTDHATWRWCFGMNLPLSALIIVSTILFVDTPQNQDLRQLSIWEKIKRFDILGTAALTGSFFCLIFALQLGGSNTWDDGRVIALLVVFGVLLAAVVAHQLFFQPQSEPALRDYNIWLTSIYAGCISGGMFIPVTYMPVWFQCVQGASAFQSGVRVTPLIVSFVVMSIISGVVTQKIGYYNPAMIFGVVLTAVGSGLLTTLEPHTLHSSWIGFQALYGLGAGAGVPPPMLVVQTILQEKDVPMGVAIVSLSQMLWSSIVVAAAQSLFENTLKARMSRVLPDSNIEQLLRIGAKDLQLSYTADELVKAIPVYSDALTRVFLITVAVGCLACPCAFAIRWQSMKAKAGTGVHTLPSEA